MNEDTERQMANALRQAGGYMRYQKYRVAWAFWKKALFGVFLLGTCLMETLHYMGGH